MSELSAFPEIAETSPLLQLVSTKWETALTLRKQWNICKSLYSVKFVELSIYGF